MSRPGEETCAVAENVTVSIRPNNVGGYDAIFDWGIGRREMERVADRNAAIELVDRRVNRLSEFKRT